MKTSTLLIMTIITLIVSGNVFSNTINVTTGTDSIPGSLRDAYNNAQSGDIITFDNSLTEIKLGGQITIDKSITISGNPNLIIYVDVPKTLYRVFEINGTNAITVNINNLTLRKTHCSYFSDPVTYDANGGIILAHNTNSIVNINYCYFNGYSGACGGNVQPYNLNGQNGGAIAQGGGVVNISNCTFAHLFSSTYVYWGVGGAIYEALGTMNLKNCTFFDNECGLNANHNMGSGAAIHSQNSTLNITNCTFCENVTSDLFYSPTTYVITLSNSSLTIKNSILFNNDGNRDITGSINSGGYNIFGQTTVTGSVASDIFNCNPGFNLVSGNVVLSNSTFWIPLCALDNSGGCAIDALPAGGNGAPPYDERGFARYYNPDIGAYEYNGINTANIFSYKSPFILSIYPNPAINNITIESSQQAIIEISNIQGQIIKTVAASDNKINIDISGFAKGIYLIKVKTDKEIAFDKFIKQ